MFSLGRLQQQAIKNSSVQPSNDFYTPHAVGLVHRVEVGRVRLGEIKSDVSCSSSATVSLTPCDGTLSR